MRRRSPGAANPRATATSGLQANEAKTYFATDDRQDRADAHDDVGLFDVDIVNGAYGRTTTFSVPSYDVRGPGPRPPTTGPKDAGAPMWWWSTAEKLVVEKVANGGTVTADDLHELLPDEPSATGAAFGGLLARMANDGRIREVGWQPSRRPAARRRRVVAWGAP